MPVLCLPSIHTCTPQYAIVIYILSGLYSLVSIMKPLCDLFQCKLTVESVFYKLSKCKREGMCFYYGFEKTPKHLPSVQTDYILIDRPTKLQMLEL